MWKVWYYLDMTKLNRTANLNKARQVKNDEFYTMYDDVVKLFAVYDEDVRGKTLYLPFDDYEHSNFFKYYRDNFTRLGLKRLIATSYKAGEVSKRVDIVDGDMTVSDLAGDGDFFSDECQAILKSEADIVISNPPFSCIREIIKKFDESGKQFALMAHITILCYPYVFNKLASDTYFCGLTTSLYFATDFEGKGRTASVPCTTLNNVKPVKQLTYKKRNFQEEIYKVDGEDELHTINKLDVLDHVPAHITKLAVPITILGTVFEDEWQLVGETNEVKVGGVKKFHRIIIQRKPLPEPEDL